MDPRDQSMAITYAPQEESTPNSFASKWEYDVFLSFAGKDTRFNFTDHLYDAFIRNGIRSFRDAEGIEKGQVIKEELLQAIKGSLSAVVVLSENYANSTWCLDELQEILQSRKKFGLQVFPVFYDVNPSDVRHQRESFRKALADHEKRFEKSKDNKVQIWREALSEVSNLSGWDSRNRPETKVIGDIVEAIWKTVSVFSNFPSYNEKLVGIEARMVKINSLLEVKANDIRFVGIWGMGGVGKTTLARVVYERMSGQFEMSCFLANVREMSERQQGLVSLQKYILSHLNRPQEINDENFGQICLKRLFYNKKVLLVLDDVSLVSQLENLALPEWFCPGSRVIITTRELQLLKPQGLYSIYELEPMGKDESLELFSKKAFNKDHPEHRYLELSKTVVEYAGGLPLALHVFGSSLYKRSLIEWKESVEMMKNIREDVFKILKTSYLGLKDEQKTMFLDIACFFNGWKRDEVAQILKNCNFHPTIGLNILIEKALLIEKKTLDGETILEVHDLLQELARSIVFQESPSHIHGRSRLWNLEDIDEVLKNDQGSQAIQAIVMPYNLDGEIIVHPEAFSKKCNIRLLIVSSKLKLPNGLKCFPRALQVIQWRKFPLKTLPFGTRLEKLVEIQMPLSKIKHWNGMQLMENLKFLDLSNSEDLVETPDFSKIPNLEKLNLEGCLSLFAIHHSHGQLEKLVELNLSRCKRLQILSKKLEMISLTKLDISGCNQLSVLPEFGECMEKLTMLDLSYCGISDGSIPKDFGRLSSLATLHLEGNYFTNLPSGCFSNLFQLLHLYLNNCERLKSLPKLPRNLIHLDASGCKSMQPLSSNGMWNLFSSLVHEDRLQTNHEKRVLQPIQSGYVPEADFLAIMPNSEMPSWFPNRCSLLKTSSFINGPLDYELVVDVPPYFRASKWCGLAICLQVQGMPSSNNAKCVISWSCKAPKDDNFSQEYWVNQISIANAWDPYLYLMLLDFNEKTCWQHLRGNNNRLHIKLSFTHKDPRALNLVCKWRALCKEKMPDWGNYIFYNNKITQAEHNACPEQPPSPEQNQGTINPMLAWWKQLALPEYNRRTLVYIPFLGVMLLSCLFWFLQIVIMK